MHRSFRPAISALLLSAAGCVALAACGTASKFSPSLRMETAKHIGTVAGMQEADIPAGEFTVLAYEKIGVSGKPATVYIEGDGNLGFDDMSLSGDPTPTNPVALRMAADDGGQNVVWLARPCQYTVAMNVRACTKALYTTHRYSPQALDAMNAALENVKKRYNIPSFTLVGYGGGAAVAVELASVRSDVTLIRTVAGILDTRIAAEGLKDDPFTGSLNPVDAAPRVAHIPQIHSVGAWELKKTLAMIDSFKAASGNASSVTVDMGGLMGGLAGDAPTSLQQ